MMPTESFLPLLLGGSTPTALTGLPPRPVSRLGFVAGSETVAASAAPIICRHRRSAAVLAALRPGMRLGPHTYVGWTFRLLRRSCIRFHNATLAGSALVMMPTESFLPQTK
jgi:hypothetical protein